MTATEHLMEHATIDYSEAARLYANGWSLPKIARQFNSCSSVVLRGLRKRGVRMRNLKEAWEQRRQDFGPNGFITHRWSPR